MDTPITEGMRVVLLKDFHTSSFSFDGSGGTKISADWKAGTKIKILKIVRSTTTFGVTIACVVARRHGDEQSSFLMNANDSDFQPLTPLEQLAECGE